MDESSYSIEELIHNPSFIRWATGQADAEESGRWNRWVESGEDRRRKALKAQQKIAGISFELSLHENHKHQQTDWKEVERRIIDARIGRTYGKRARHYRKKDMWGTVLKAVAILLVGCLTGFMAFYIHQEQHSVAEAEASVETIHTDYSEKKRIALSDGSEIVLAAGSRLSYREDWLQQPTRRVTLEKGEAYFSVVPRNGQNVPRLEVRTEDGVTTVWGTEFSVQTFGDGTRVILQKGEVEVEVENAGQTSRAILLPGEMARLKKKESLIRVETVNPRVYTSWTTDELFFDETPLSVLVGRIERTYGVQVEVENPGLMNLKLSGAVDFRSLDALIGAVSEVLEIEIERIDEQVFIKKSAESNE